MREITSFITIDISLSRAEQVSLCILFPLHLNLHTWFLWMNVSFICWWCIPKPTTIALKTLWIQTNFTFNFDCHMYIRWFQLASQANDLVIITWQLHYSCRCTKRTWETCILIRTSGQTSVHFRSFSILLSGDWNMPWFCHFIGHSCILLGYDDDVGFGHYLCHESLKCFFMSYTLCFERRGRLCLFVLHKKKEGFFLSFVICLSLPVVCIWLTHSLSVNNLVQDSSSQPLLFIIVW